MKLPGSITLTTFALIGCIMSSSAQLFPYQFDRPSAVFELDKILEEISGLSMSENDEYLLAVQDEDGILFYLDKTSGAIVKKTEFWKEGDYEGVEMVGQNIYVIKSSGTVYWIQNALETNQNTEKFNYALNKDDDVEGLGYDKKNNLLLLACKAKPDGKKDRRGIYGFSLEWKNMLEAPIYLLTLQAIQEYLEKNPAINRLEKIKDFYDEEELDFSPSALAVHPISGDLYLLSSKGKMILVMNRNNEVVHIEKLQKEEHPQPEGMCFDRQGNIYIANEGKDGRASILIYKYAAN